MSKKILIFGNGQIANFYKNYFGAKGDELQIADADITDIDGAKKPRTVTKEVEAVLKAKLGK